MDDISQVAKRVIARKRAYLSKAKLHGPARSKTTHATRVRQK